MSKTDELALQQEPSVSLMSEAAKRLIYARGILVCDSMFGLNGRWQKHTTFVGHPHTFRSDILMLHHCLLTLINHTADKDAHIDRKYYYLVDEMTPEQTAVKFRKTYRYLLSNLCNKLSIQYSDDELNAFIDDLMVNLNINTLSETPIDRFVNSSRTDFISIDINRYDLYDMTLSGAAMYSIVGSLSDRQARWKKGEEEPQRSRDNVIYECFRMALSPITDGSIQFGVSQLCLDIPNRSARHVGFVIDPSYLMD